MELCNGMDERTSVASGAKRVTSAQIHEKHKEEDMVKIEKNKVMGVLVLVFLTISTFSFTGLSAKDNITPGLLVKSHKAPRTEIEGLEKLMEVCTCSTQEGRI